MCQQDALPSCHRCKGTPVTAYSLHPGVINTNLQRHMGAMGSVFRFIGKFFNKTVEQVGS